MMFSELPACCPYCHQDGNSSLAYHLEFHCRLRVWYWYSILPYGRGCMCGVEFIDEHGKGHVGLASYKLDQHLFAGCKVFERELFTRALKLEL